jgi:ribosomal protein S18 acetylase RimI-like enzyme
VFPFVLRYSSNGLLNRLGNEAFFESIQTFMPILSSYRNTSYTFTDFKMENKNIRNLHYYMMFDSYKIIGFCKTETTLNNRAYLYSYLIHPDYRSCKISKSHTYNKLFMNTVCNSLQHNHNIVELKVHEDNEKAFRGYLRDGFRDTGKLEKRYLMEKNLC